MAPPTGMGDGGQVSRAQGDIRSTSSGHVLGPQGWPPPPRLDAVIFDLGGTLIDYLGGASNWPAMEVPGIQALHACLSAAGFPLEADIFHDMFIRAMDKRWRAATAAQGDPPTIGSLILEACAAAGFHLADELQRGAVAAYCAPIAERAAARKGARDVLTWLREHGVRLGLISNTLWPGDIHRLDLQRYGLLPHLDCLVFSSECRLWKPDTRIFELVLERLGAAPECAVFVGDRLAEDIHGAQRAGLRAVLIEAAQDHEDLDPRAFTPDACIQQLAELPTTLAALWGSQPPRRQRRQGDS